MWMSGELDIDGCCIYFMPCFASRMLKLYPDDDTVTSLGEDFEGEHCFKYMGMAAGKDNCLYGIPAETGRIVRFDPVTLSTTFVVEGAMILIVFVVVWLAEMDTSMPSVVPMKNLNLPLVKNTKRKRC